MPQVHVQESGAVCKSLLFFADFFAGMDAVYDVTQWGQASRLQGFTF